jgi:hypothetical protein
MGAAKIFMAPSSELGPVDPQIFRREDGRVKSFSAHALVTGYDRLFAEAVKTKGKLEPYMQQLQYYDDRDINSYRTIINLSENIAIRALKTGMMSALSEDDIKKQIQVFLNPLAGTLTHGRPIYENEAHQCGLEVEHMDVKSSIWRDIHELYARLDRFVSMEACKAVESIAEQFHVKAPEYD